MKLLFLSPGPSACQPIRQFMCQSNTQPNSLLDSHNASQPASGPAS